MINFYIYSVTYLLILVALLKLSVTKNNIIRDKIAYMIMKTDINNTNINSNENTSMLVFFVPIINLFYIAFIIFIFTSNEKTWKSFVDLITSK